MRIRMIGMLVAGSFAVASCGSTGGKSASVLRPADPVNLSVYVSNSRVSVSPTSVGAGPIDFIVTNQSDRAQSLAISSGGGSRTLASTAPINPQGTTQVTVDVRPGTYTIGIASRGRTDAELSQQSPIQAASIHIGHARPSSSNQVLQP